mgnify:CR=1 FL=1|tara:strand:+ start:207 stop:833 length:627 start_codon:yes stop_codon:yes gene_type:complete
MRSSEQLNELYTALALAQGEIESAAKDGKNPHFKSTYATLESVIEAIRGPLSKHGLSMMQLPDFTEQGGVILINRLAHKSGQWLESSYPVTPLQNTPQAMGSALTYAKRYCLMSFLLVPADDDGNEATKPAPRPLAPPAQMEAPINKAADIMRGVEAEQRRRTAKPTTEEQQVCSHKWLKSKFKQDEEYCMHCKLVRKIATDLGNIPF